MSIRSELSRREFLQMASVAAVSAALAACTPPAANSTCAATAPPHPTSHQPEAGLHTTEISTPPTSTLPKNCPRKPAARQHASNLPWLPELVSRGAGVPPAAHGGAARTPAMLGALEDLLHLPPAAPLHAPGVKTYNRRARANRQRAELRGQPQRLHVC